MKRNAYTTDFIAVNTKDDSIINKLANTGDLFSFFIIFPFVYTLFTIIINEKIADSLLNTVANLILNIFMLLFPSFVVLSYKKKNKEVNLSGKEISTIFTLSIAMNVVYLISYCVKDISSAMILVINLTLYTGFAVSLEDAFSIKRKREFLFCFFKPLFDFGIRINDWWKVAIAVVLLSVIPWIDFRILVLIFIVLIFTILVVASVLQKIRKRSVSIFCNEIIKFSENKHVLLLRFGPSNAGIKRIIETFDSLEEKSVKHICRKKYDALVILNTLTKIEDSIPYIENMCKQLKPDGKIIDPFISKNNKRCFLFYWFGIPASFFEHKKQKKYLNILMKMKK